MNRQIWTYPRFTRTNHPTWPCPTCDKGTLKLVKDSLFSEETSASKENHSHEDWDPTWIILNFSSFFKCDYCQEPVGISGWGGIIESFRSLPNGDVNDSTEEEFYPEFFTIPPKLIEIPIECDVEIEMEIEKSFQLFYFDNNSCGNKIRISIELLLDEFKIPRKKRLTRNGRVEVKNITLHERITRYAQKNPKVAERLLAIKWIGNFGSHGASLQRSDLLDAYEILETALREIYDDDKKRADKLTNAINKKKGPINKKPKLR